MAQVRLDADVEGALSAAAARDGLSLAHVANARLRAALGLRAASGAPAAPASLQAPGARGCKHPVSRRIGGRCALCGAAVR